MKRPSQGEYFMLMAQLAATRSNCYRRQVGCVLVDKNNHILSTGYNGSPKGVPHCKKGECPRDTPGENLHICIATHGEINALLQCHDIDKIDQIYVTDSPCLTCTAALLNTNCRQIYFGRTYPGNDQARIVWEQQGRLWRQFDETE